MVGIFWRFEGEIIGWRCEVSDGEPVGDIVDSPENHYTYWPELQRQRPELRKLEYEDVPRGRILFDRAAGRSRVLLNKALLLPAIKKQICEFFALRQRATDFVSDVHYTTDPDELRRLFDP